MVENQLNNYLIVGFVSILTVYTLFFDDLRVLALDKDYDPIFFGITASCFIIFSVEIAIASACREVYFLTFFFWLDIISTISMLPDIGWLWDVVTGQGGSPQTGNAAQLVKTSRAGRVTRIIRVIRLIRLIRIVKLYRQAKLAEKMKED
jgi:Ion transport protein